MAERNLCCGARKRTGAFLAAGSALVLSLGLILMISILLITGYRESKNPNASRGIGNMYAASMVVLACWSILTFVLIGGIRVENKRALLVWLAFSVLLPLLLVCNLAYLLATHQYATTEIVFLVVLGLAVVVTAYLAAVIYYYYIEVKRRDKDPNLRADEYASRKMYNPSMGLPYELNTPATALGAAASEGSVFRNERAAMGTDGASAGPSGRRGSRPSSRSTSRDNLAEREGGGEVSAYYRYQYSAEKPYEKVRGSRSSLSGSRNVLASTQQQQQPSTSAARDDDSDAAGHGGSSVV